MMASVLGIDPGQHGGAAWLTADGRLEQTLPVPRRRDGIDWIEYGRQLGMILRYGLFDVVLERPQVRLQGGEVFAGADTLLIEYGKLLGTLAALSVNLGGRVHEIYPVTWQAYWRLTQMRPKRKTPLRKLPPKERAQARTEANKRNKALAGRIANARWPDAAHRFAECWTEGTWEAALIGEAWRCKQIIAYKNTTVSPVFSHSGDHP